MHRKNTFTLSPTALARIGASPKQVCLAAGLRTATELETDDFFRLWTWAETQLGDHAVGLKMGADGLEAGYGVAGLVALHAPDFGSALRSLARYKQLICPELVDIAVDGEEVLVRFRWLEASGPAPRLLVDMTLASLGALAFHGTKGIVRPLRVDLARRNDSQQYVQAHFSCPVRCGAEADTMVFERAALKVPMVTADRAPFEALVREMDLRLAEGQGLSQAAALRHALARLLSDGRPPTLASAASRLNVSRRTLQRQLLNEGTGFQQELAHVRRVVARRLLMQTQLDPVAIALLLGFSEPNSFVRRFRAWERTTPLRWRAGHAERTL
ncbi:AraC family transcriptional regulator [Xinfangfangia pollutisoli]|uniref:AraC family transcriptional regulator n=1 Tax=Xinfangfangia pollutisoli TaxID=2865960 RepID=UPI001CD6E189|nr:AraC family transcriptional regulator [Xinfangfangia pollutisoli]